MQLRRLLAVAVLLLTHVASAQVARSPFLFGAPPGGVDPRWDNLSAGWKLDETSDGSAPVARADVLGVLELTDSNTVPSVAGVIGNAASFTAANSERLFRATLSLGAWNTTGLTWSFWYKISGDVFPLFVRDDFSVREYTVARQNNSVKWTLFGVDDFAGSADSGTGVFNHAVLTFDPVDNKARIYINGGAATVSAAGTPTAGTVALEFGGRSASAEYGTSVLDEAYVFNVAKDAAWVTGMYNSGAGRSYPD